VKYIIDDTYIVIRFDKGDLLIKNLTELVKSEDIRGAWLSGLGAAQWVELGFYSLEQKAYQLQKFDKLLEITSLQGNISWHQNEPVAHIHGTFADDEMRAFGGHVKELSVGGTCEVILNRLPIGTRLMRKKDDSTGFATFDF